MATYTENYNLKKPAETDFVDIADINANMDAIDDIVKDVKNTAEIVSVIEGYCGYDGYNDVLGLQVDYENKRFTRLAAAKDLEAGADFDKFPMYGGMKRCILEYWGGVSAYYGDSHYAEEYGTNCSDVMVEMPAFYYKVVPLKLERNSNGLGYHIRKANYFISSNPYPGFKRHPFFFDTNGDEIEYGYYSAYEASMKDSTNNNGIYKIVNDADSNENYVFDEDQVRLFSIPKVKPITGQNIAFTREKAEKYASKMNNDTAAWHIETIQAISAVQFLMMIEYGTMELQTAVSEGVTNIGYSDADGINYSANTGSTSSFGNQSGEADTTIYHYFDKENNQKAQITANENKKLSFSYRGIENPYGNIWRFIQGVNVWGDGEMAGGQPYICENFAFAEAKNNGNYHAAGFTIPNGNGFISAMGYGNEKYDWLFLPSEFSGSSVYPVGDRWYSSEKLNAYRVVRHGGAWNYGYSAGMFAGTNSTLPTTSGAATGCRLICVPFRKEK